MNHIPVLLDSVLETLGGVSGKTIIDATFGAGGYSRAFLERGAKVIAFDRDPSVMPSAEKLAGEFPGKFKFINEPFSAISNQQSAIFDAIVFDLGISSMQIDTPERGFSWRFDAPLDMRMDAPAVQSIEQQRAKSIDSLSATDLIASASVGGLAEILRDYGDVRKAVPIAAAIKNALPRTTFALRDLIHNPKDIAPVFQALRMAVNDELGEIECALGAVPDLLAPGGICTCVTFHSLEDRLVKNKFREWTVQKGDPRLPAPLGGQTLSPQFQLLKTCRPSREELAANPRARSAHLRGVRKL